MKLEHYREQIKLDEPYTFPEEPLLDETEQNKLIDSLLRVLIHDEGLRSINQIPETYSEKRQLLRGLMNIRPPEPVDPVFLENINRLLRDETRFKDLISVGELDTVEEMVKDSRVGQKDKLVLWRGDITLLKADAIVNAANNQLLGCFQPLHNCIDNVIHTASGPTLREDCKIIMDISGRLEDTGDAKITRAYNLPSRFVLHTVGPIIQQTPVPEYQRDQLASCYRSCLNLASQIQDITTIAFPCISTGVFRFPRDLAAEIAIRTVVTWLDDHPDRFTRVIFNVFLQEDFDEYFRTFQRIGS